MDDFKPAGYNSVSPYLVVNGAQRMIDLLKKVFNVQDLRKYETPDGKIMHSEVRLDDSVIMIADATEMWPQNQSLLHVYVAGTWTRSTAKLLMRVVRRASNQRNAMETRIEEVDFAISPAITGRSARKLLESRRPIIR